MKRSRTTESSGVSAGGVPARAPSLLRWLLVPSLLGICASRPTGRRPSRGAERLLLLQHGAGHPLARAAPLGERPFVWHLHFHRAAGTSVGELARRNGLQLAPNEPETHGHLELGPGNIYGQNAEHIVERLTELRAKGVGFGSTEHWFPDPGTFAEIQLRAPWVKFMTVVRDPVQRTISSYRNHKGGGARCSEERCSNTIAFGRAEANLMARMLGGLPFGPVALDQKPVLFEQQASQIAGDPRAAERAAEVLERFDVVLIQERLSDQRVGFILGDRLGWTAVHFKQTHAFDPDVGPDVGKEPDALQELEAVNTIDREIYKRALLQYELQSTG